MYTITHHRNGLVTIVTFGDKAPWHAAGVECDIVEITEYRDPTGVSRCARIVLSCYNTDHDDGSGDITITDTTRYDL